MSTDMEIQNTESDEVANTKNVPQEEKIGKMGCGNGTIAGVDTPTSDDDTHAQEECSHKDNVEPVDNQQIEDSTCDNLELLPFFASEMDQIDGGKSRVDEKVNKAATKNSGSKRVSERKRQKKSKKKTEKEAKPKKPLPNAFVAIRIPSPDINAKFQEVQEVLKEKDERLKQLFVPSTKNHITLMVMRLNNPEEIERYADRYIIMSR